LAFRAKRVLPDDVCTRTRDVKKQINSSIKAHLLRSALILLSLLAICAIPFALAQSRSRETTKRSVASRTDQSQLPTKTIGPLGVPAFQMPPVPKLPAVVLYDQLNNPGTFAVSSQEFPDSPAFTDFSADDFVVPSGQTWTITEVDAEGVYLGPGPADNFNVFVYQNNGSLPGTQVYSATAQSYVNSAGVFQVTLTVPAVLAAGTYWVSVQAHMNLTPNGQWGWIERTVQANSPAAWQNPGGGFGAPSSCPAPGCPMPCPNCITWGIRQCCAGSPAGEPDQMFRLIGVTTGGGTPTPTATGTPSPTATGTPSPTATGTPSATASSTPTPGSCTSYEAESGTLAGGAVVLNCPTCSGGAKVGYVGNNSGTLQFNGVSAIATGPYTMTICYLNGDAVRYALLSVNGSQGMPVSFPSTGSFQTVGSIQITILLTAGSNTLEFYNPIVGDWAPDFDRIQFNCPTCTVSAPSPTPTPTSTPTSTPTQTPTPTPGLDGCYPAFTTAEGCNALSSLTTGAGNTGLGWRSLFANSTGNFNTDVGGGALALNNADSNTAVGAAALLLNTSGTQNTAVGTDAMVFNDSGDSNTATGYFALMNNATGGSNTAIGWEALIANTSGNNNTAIGNLALESNVSNSDHVALGRMAGSGITTVDNNIIIGHHSGVHSVFGQVSDRTIIGNISGAPVSAATAAIVMVDSDGRLGTFTMDGPDPGGFSPKGIRPQAIPDAAKQAMLNLEVQKLEATIPQQQNQIEMLTAQLKEQTAQIQKVNARLEMNKPAAKIIVNKPKAVP